MLKEWCSGPAPPLRNTMQSVVWIKNRGLFSAARAGPQDARQQKEFRQRVRVAPTKMQTGFFAWNLLYIWVVVVLWIQLDKLKRFMSSEDSESQPFYVGRIPKALSDELHCHQRHVELSLTWILFYTCVSLSSNTVFTNELN